MDLALGIQNLVTFGDLGDKELATLQQDRPVAALDRFVT